MVKNYDIFGVLETKMDDADLVSLDGYTFIGQTRKQNTYVNRVELVHS